MIKAEEVKDCPMCGGKGKYIFTDCVDYNLATNGS